MNAGKHMDAGGIVNHPEFATPIPGVKRFASLREEIDPRFGFRILQPDANDSPEWSCMGSAGFDGVGPKTW